MGSNCLRVMFPQIKSTLPARESKGGWLSDDTLARERRQLYYGMRNQYINKSPPLHAKHVRHVRGIYSLATPTQFLTRKQARCCASKRRPTEFEIGKRKAAMITKLIQPRQFNVLSENCSIDGHTLDTWGSDDSTLGQLRSPGESHHELGKDVESSWTEEFQAGVRFWTNMLTGESRADTPDHLKQPNPMAMETSTKMQLTGLQENAIGTGSLVYDSQGYLEFMNLINRAQCSGQG